MDRYFAGILSGKLKNRSGRMHREMDEYCARKIRFAMTEDRPIDKLVTAFSERTANRGDVDLRYGRRSNLV